MFSQLTISVQIQLVASCISAFVAIISIIIAVATLKQTNRITKEANRPYVVLYYDSIQVTSTIVNYLVIKNLGRTGAVIDSVSHFPLFESKYGRTPFTELQNHFIAPNQTVTTACDLKECKEPVTFEVKYHDQGKTYYETFIINHQAISPNILAKTSDTNAPLEKIVAYATQELIRKQL